MTSTVSSAEPLVQGAFFKPCELSAPFNWQPGLLRKLDELRCMGQFCDVTIQVDDTIGDASFLPYMRVHSVIVAAGSPMLHEKLQDPSFAGSVLVAGVGVWQWEQVINFLYTGKVCLTASGQAEALVQAAIELKMEVLVNMLQDHLGPSDAAAVEDVKPLKSRQAADTSEPMDDDDEDNDAGAASIDDGEDDNVEPLSPVKTTPPLKQKRKKPTKSDSKVLSQALIDDEDDYTEPLSTVKTTPVKTPPLKKKRKRPSRSVRKVLVPASKEDDDDDDEEFSPIESLPSVQTTPLKRKRGKIIPTEAEYSNHDNFEQMPVVQETSPTIKKRGRPRKNTIKGEKYGKVDELDDVDWVCPSDEDVIDTSRTLRMRTRRSEVSSENLATEGNEEHDEIEEYDVDESRVPEKERKKRTCENCQKSFLYEKSYLKHFIACSKAILNKESATGESQVDVEDLSQKLEDALKADAKHVRTSRRPLAKVINTTCKTCEKFFKYDRNLLKHTCKVTKSTCHKCAQTFLYEGKFLKHSCSEWASNDSSKEEDPANAAPKDQGNDVHVSSKVACDPYCDPSVECKEAAVHSVLKKGNRIINKTCEQCKKTFVNWKCFQRHRCAVKITSYTRKEKAEEYEKFLCHDGEFIDLVIPEIFCPKCDEKFADQKLFDAHAKEKHDMELGVVVQCPFCEVQKREILLIQHIWKYHGYRVSTPPGQRPRIYHKCSECDYRDLPHNLVRHYDSIHKGLSKYMCDLCGKRVKTRYTLRTHMRTHTDERPYPCKYCEKRFRCTVTLGKHELLHLGHKPYACNLCGKQCTQSITLNLHIKSQHPHIPQDQYAQHRTYTPLSEAIRNTSVVKPLRMDTRCKEGINTASGSSQQQERSPTPPSGTLHQSASPHQPGSSTIDASTINWNSVYTYVEETGVLTQVSGRIGSMDNNA